MPLEHGAKPGSPGFGRNIAEMIKSGHAQKQAVAAAFSEAERGKTRDAMPASVKILGGSDPAGSQELTSVPRREPPTAAGTAQNMGAPNTTSLPEPYPWTNPPVASRTVHPQPRVATPVVGGEEVAVKEVGRSATKDDLAEANSSEAEGHGMLESAIRSTHPAEGASPVVDEHVGFKAVEKHAAAEGARDPAAVAAAVGIKKYGKAGMERKAEAGKK